MEHQTTSVDAPGFIKAVHGVRYRDIQQVQALPGYGLRLGLSDGQIIEGDPGDLVPGRTRSPTTF